MLLIGVIAYAKDHSHPKERERTVWEWFKAERAALVPYADRFDGFHAVPASGHDIDRRPCSVVRALQALGASPATPNARVRMSVC